MRISDWSSDVCSSDLPVADALTLTTSRRARGGGNARAADVTAKIIAELGEGRFVMTVAPDARGWLMDSQGRFPTHVALPARRTVQMTRSPPASCPRALARVF